MKQRGLLINQYILYIKHHGRNYCLAALALLLSAACQVSAQTAYKWWDPQQNSFPVVEGLSSTAPYFTAATNNKRPAKIAGNRMAEEIHEGLYLKFNSDATELVVRYVLQHKTGNAAGLPLTAAAGIDLYAIDHNGNWIWLPAKSSWGDTVVFRYANLAIDPAYKGRDVECRLFFPLAAKIHWMQVGVPAANSFTPLPLQPEKPVLVYGGCNTSNAVVSRPGLACLPVLERKLDRPFIFTDKQTATDKWAGTDAKLFVLDCLPGTGETIGETSVETDIVQAVEAIRAHHPAVPVLLVEKAVTTIDTVDSKIIAQQNAALQKAYAGLMEKGIKELYMLTAREAGLANDATVDGNKFSETGMAQYAAAFEQAIRSALKEPVGSISTTIPVVQSRDGLYNWRSRHAAVLEINKKQPPANIILANSIIHYWSGLPKGPFSRGDDSWNTYLAPLDVRNQGFGWDRIENVLWRVYHDELDGFKAKHILVMIGTNNLSAGTDNDNEIIEGLRMLVKAIHLRQPEARLLLSGLLPRRNLEQRIVQLNNRIAALAGSVGAGYINAGKLLLNSQGKIEETYFGDGLHPNATGYRIIAPVLAAALKDE